MKKYGLFTLTPKGTDVSKYPKPTNEEMLEVLTTAGHSSSEIDRIHGLVVWCERKPKDFEQYGYYWVEI